MLADISGDAYTPFINAPVEETTMRTHAPSWLAIVTLVLPFVLACSEDVSAPTSEVPDMTLGELADAPETLVLGQQQYRLDTYLWRDFMPISPPNGKPLVAFVELVSDDQGTIPDNVELVYIWVVNGSRVWAATFPDGSDRTEGYARGGPKWGPDIFVDVVVAVTTGSGIRLVRARAQEIHATY
jgi:hypothetical protein